MNNSGNILIVDDNPNNLLILATILQNEGYIVRPALSGALALRAIDSNIPDLILLDVRMPEMDGYETCRRIKENEKHRDIPVIFISALNEIEDKLLAFGAGAVDYITKPFQAEEVLARVRTQTELAKTRKALADTGARLLALMDHLVQAEKLKSLGFLAAGVAHELNTPIGNAMLGASTIEELLREFSEAQATGAAGPSIAELLSFSQDSIEIILRNLHRASKLIASLKEVTVDRASERRRSIQLLETVNNVVAVMTTLRKTAYVVTIDIDPLLTIETYPGHLEQILENLLQNAIIHGFDGAPSGAIKLSAHGNADNTISIVVADNGIGIWTENLKRVFDPFFTTKLGQGGSGLGLHIVYNLVTGILGGSISVTSTVGKGAEFILKLPMVAPNSAEQSHSEAMSLKQR